MSWVGKEGQQLDNASYRVDIKSRYESRPTLTTLRNTAAVDTIIHGLFERIRG
jgi:hypothetical protein